MAGIFKAYDIRGTVPEQLNDDMAYKIGKAAGIFFGKSPIIVGRDMRESGIELSENLIRGLNDVGIDVINVGLIETPMINFSTVFLAAAGGIMITASHNPAGYNGFKFCREEAKPVGYDSGIDEIERLAYEDIELSERKGAVIDKDVYEDYIDYLLSYVKNWKPLKIVVDAGNGMAGKTIPKFFKAVAEKKGVKMDVIPLFFELDGNFPNHDANPLDFDNMIDLQKKIKETNAHLGVAFDGDADRSGYVDEKSEIVTNDYVSIVIAMEYLKNNPKATFLYDIRTTWSFKETVEKMGGIAKKCKVGHSNIKEALRKENAIFAGELAGHYYFKENFNTDSGIIAMIMIINLMCEENKKLSEFVDPLKKYFSSGEINSKITDPDEKMKELAEKYSYGNIEYIDGISVEFTDWWFNVRKSNTEPVLRFICEATTKKLMEEKRDEVINLIRS
ncbi:MAG: phosphomannomutase/phosphoglucomutase [Candidatus Muirbacterium halophilum]|nr:phosphomannomutase/phosphoglucomutase [Candidatus Muirbacterium halophilum]MCK9474654.1 phosphomannomutase/phosphoglucomutase [Candidatus Muirbacterium halophilum]